MDLERMHEQTRTLYQEKIAFIGKDIQNLEDHPEVFIEKLKRVLPLQIEQKRRDMETVKQNPKAVDICMRFIAALEEDLREVEERPEEVVEKHKRAWNAQLEQAKVDFGKFTQRKN